MIHDFEPMIIKVEVTKDLYIKNLITSLRLGFKRIFLIALVLAIVSYLIVNYNNLNWKSFLDDTSLLLLIYLLMIYIIVFKKSYKRVKTSLQKLSKKPIFQEYTLNPEGISINGEKENLFYPWVEIKQARLRDGNVVIYLQNKQNFDIPKSFFATPEDVNVFLEITHDKVRKTTK
jgi:hypothetical protein